MAASLLKTKLHIPPLRSGLVSRPRLIERLEDGCRPGRKLILVSAPAGFGKTTLLCEWAHAADRSEESRVGRTKESAPARHPTFYSLLPTLSFAWLSLDEADNDPARFWAYLSAALQTVGIEADALAPAFDPSFQRPSLEPALTALLNRLDDLPGQRVLVLDDYHLIHAQPIHDALSFLIEHLPPQMRLAIATRADPPLPVARLRARGQLTGLYQADLRFTPEEAAGFLNDGMGLSLSAADVNALEGRTEGWIAALQMAGLHLAGLQLTALSTRGRQDLDGFIRALTGSQRYILDYLAEEVLQGQPTAVQQFLLQTSILDRLCGPLCDAVIGAGREGDAQAALEELERNNLFVVPLDDERRWYRYHGLFADLLRRTLGQRQSADEIRELHHRASRWLQAAGFPEEAMSHAMAAGDFERAASMIEDNIVRMFSYSEVPVLLGWIEKLPEALVRRRPWIDVYRATTLALASRLEGLDPLLEDVERRIAPDTAGVPGVPQAPALLGHVAAIRAYVANLRGDAAGAVEQAAMAVEHLPEGHPTARGMAAYAVADTRLAADDMEGAEQALSDMLRAGEGSGQLMLIVHALCERAAIEMIRGRLHQAEGLYGRARQALVDRQGLDSRMRCSYEFGLADLLREWNQLDAAYEHVTIGDEVRRRLGGYVVSGDLPLMRILQARGDVEGALRVLRDAEQSMQAYPFSPATAIAFRTARVLQWLAVGDVETAGRWAEECDGGSERERIALARLRLAQGRAADMQRLLDGQRALAEAGGRTGRTIEILALLALALDAQGCSGEAQAALTRALSLARPEGYVRVFLDLGGPLHDLLGRLDAPAPPLGDYVRALLDAFRREAARGREAEAASRPSAPGQPSIDPLTERELDVLSLLAEGFTNKQIAARLVVAPSTVKQHLKNIYDKLDVHSRTQAVARGRELGLL